MSKYRKGRLLVLTGMLAFSTATVLVGSASAGSSKGNSGTIKIADSSVEKNGNNPHINGCVNVDTTEYESGIEVTYYLLPPTGDSVKLADPIAVGAGTTQQANLWYLIQNAQGSNAQAGPYHIKAVVDSPDGSKQKVFWLGEPWTCQVPAPPSGGNT